MFESPIHAILSFDIPDENIDQVKGNINDCGHRCFWDTTIELDPIKEEVIVEDIETEVWVVDNNSSDGSVNMLQKDFPKVKLIANNNNPGFSAANNQAIKHSIGENILLLNPDTKVPKDTFKKCLNLAEICKQIPLNKLLVETDSPYLSPHPFRGKVNHPQNTSLVVKKIAEIKQKNFEEISKITTDNFNELFKINYKDNT